MQEDPAGGQLRPLLTTVEFLEQQSCIRRGSGGDVDAVILQPYSLTEQMFNVQRPKVILGSNHLWSSRQR